MTNLSTRDLFISIWCLVSIYILKFYVKENIIRSIFTFVLVDEVDASSKYPTCSFSSLRHEKLNGGIICADLVKSTDILPYQEKSNFEKLSYRKLAEKFCTLDLKRPHETIKNSSLERFFFPFTIFSSTGGATLFKLFRIEFEDNRIPWEKLIFSESNHTLLSPKLEVEQFQNGINKNSRVMESSVFVPELSVNGKITLTAFCLAQNETGTSNWLVSGKNFEKFLC